MRQESHRQRAQGIAALLFVSSIAITFLASPASRAADGPADYVLVSQKEGVTHVKSGKTKATLFQSPRPQEAIHWAMNQNDMC